MELRAVRLEMSRPGGAMLKLDEVLRALIGSWRESQNQVAVHPKPVERPAAPAPGRAPESPAKDECKHPGVGRKQRCAACGGYNV